MQNSDLNQTTNNDKYSFISLYLFILIFFIIINQLIDQTENGDMLDKFINKLAKSDKELYLKHQNNADRGAIYYSKKVNAFLPAEASRIKVIDAQKSKKLEWKEVIFDEDLTDLFKSKVDEIVKYIKNSANDYSIIFLVSTEDHSKAILALTLLSLYSSQIQDIHIVIELEKPQSEDQVRILVSNK